MYEQYRNEVKVALADILTDDKLKQAMSLIDNVSQYYAIEKKETLPAVIDYIPKEMNLYLASKKIEGYSENTLEGRGYVLSNFFTTVRKSVADVTTNDVRMYMYMYQEERGSSPASMDKLRQRLDAFFKWCLEENYIDKNPCQTIKRVKQEHKQKPYLTKIELEQVRNTCKDLRQKTMLEFMYSTAYRVSEVCNCRIENIDFHEGTISVMGKGNKEYKSYLSSRCMLLLKEYIGDRTEGYIFITHRGGEKMSKDAVEKEFRQTFGELSKQFGKTITPHTIRHTTATHLLQSGADVTIVQKQLNHSSINTTLLYAEVSKDDVANTHKRLIG